jgi:hypothetical protein
LVTSWPTLRTEGRARSRASRLELKGKDSHDRRVRRVLETAAIAEREDDANQMYKISNKLLRLELYERAWRLRLRSIGLKERGYIPEWDGGDLTDRTILIRNYAPRESIGEELRLARFIGPVAQRARRCIVLTEPRLVPLLRRTFATADVRPRGTEEAAAFAEADVAAYYELIAFHFAKTSEEMSGYFVPLSPDPLIVNSLRHRYRLKSEGPLIGISWWSSNAAKVLPDLQSWSPLLNWKEATFVSLQYGDIAHDLENLTKLADGRLIHDAEIDQLVNLDGFAAQIAALDAIVSINNTTVDVAGMLGAPVFHILDDKSFSIWPQSGSSSWYPTMRFLYQRDRPWPDVFAEARTSVEQALAMSSAQQHDSAKTCDVATPVPPEARNRVLEKVLSLRLGVSLSSPFGKLRRMWRPS